MLKAILQATVVWALLYLLLSQGMIYSNWSLIHHPAVETIVETRVEVPYEVIIQVPAPAVAQVEADEEEEEIVHGVAKAILLDDATKTRQATLLSQLAEAKLKLHESTMMNDLQRRVNLLEHNNGMNHYDNDDDGDHHHIEQKQTTVSMDSLKILLMKPTLKSTDDKTLEELLNKALKELQTAIDTNITTTTTTPTTDKNPWLTLLLQTDFVRDDGDKANANVNVSAPPSNCPAIPHGVRVSELRAKVSQVLHSLTEQRRGRSLVRLLQERGGAVLEEQWKQPLPEGIVIVGNHDNDNDTAEVSAPTPAPATAPSAAVSMETGDKVCLMPDDLDAMIELAINSRKTELQIALTNFVQQIEPHSKLILDAVLPSGSSKTASSKFSSPPKAPITNLRQALNSEWIWYTATTVVDAFVDAVGGYIEPLDAAIDSLASDGESVGRVLVTKVLHAASTVPVPSAITNMAQNQSSSNTITAMHHS